MQKKNYLHLAAERGLPKVLRLLLERARFQNIMTVERQIIVVDSESFILSNSIDRVQEILEEKTEEADFTGYLPGAST